MLFCCFTSTVNTMVMSELKVVGYMYGKEIKVHGYISVIFPPFPEREAVFNSPGRSPGRAIVLLPVLALAAAAALAKC